MHKIKVQQENFLSKPTSVVVTGASSGIGLAQVEAFLNQGSKVIGMDIHPCSDEFKQLDNFTFIEVDLSQADDLSAKIQQFHDIFASTDVLCNTAGMLDGYSKLADMSIEDWHRIINNNLHTSFYVTRELLPFLLAKPASRIINMTSIAGLTGGGGGIAYTTAKHALVGFTKQLAYDYGKAGLRANAIAPGAIDTPMNQADFLGDGHMAKWVMDETPVGRWAQAEEVAKLSLFLASDQADYINGAIIPIDGGWLVR